jgi:hypothetical protein
MPHYFFDILHDGEDVSHDHSGVDLPDLDAAKIEALEVWKRIIREYAAGAASPLHWHIAILDQAGNVLDKVPYPSDIVTQA